MHDDITRAKITTKPRFENADFIFYHELISKAAMMKRIPTWKLHEETKVWENVAQTRLGGEFWVCYVIAHKTQENSICRQVNFRCKGSRKCLLFTLNYVVKPWKRLLNKFLYICLSRARVSAVFPSSNRSTACRACFLYLFVGNFIQRQYILRAGKCQICFVFSHLSYYYNNKLAKAMIKV